MELLPERQNRVLMEPSLHGNHKWQEIKQIVDYETLDFTSFPPIIHILYITYPHFGDNLWINSGIISGYSVYCSQQKPLFPYFSILPDRG